MTSRGQDWRASYGMDSIVEEDMSGLGLENEFYWSGFDKAGRPCLVFRASQHKRSETSKDVTAEQKVRVFRFFFFCCSLDLSSFVPLLSAR